MEETGTNDSGRPTEVARRDLPSQAQWHSVTDMHDIVRLCQSVYYRSTNHVFVCACGEHEETIKTYVSVLPSWASQTRE